MNGRYFTILEGRTDLEGDETTGLAWSPDGMALYVTYQSELNQQCCVSCDNSRTHLDFLFLW